MRTGPRVLFDVLTPKQARIAAALRDAGLDLYATCRRHMHVEEMLQMLGVPHHCFGGYGKTLREKLMESTMRQLKLIEVVKGFDAVVTFPSPEATRVAFGLGKPLVVLYDTPHADAINRLAMPLATLVIVPEATPPHMYARYCPRRIEAVPGLFEAMWTSRHTPKPVHRELGLRERGYVVIRRHERYATYSQWRLEEIEERIVRAVKELGLDPVVVPRYEEDVEWGERLGATVIRKAVDFLDLAAYAAAVITGGGTMAVEAALIGTPAATYFPGEYPQVDYLAARGAPIARCSPEKCVEELGKLLEMPRRRPNVPDPTNRIVELVREAVHGEATA